MVLSRLFLALLFVSLCAPAYAQTKPAAPAKSSAVKPAAPMQLAPQATPQTKAAPNASPPPVLGLPAANQPAQQMERRGLLNRPDPYTPAQRETIAKINRIYNAIHEMNGQFTQVENNGATTTGKFFISKPGRVRFVYDAPSAIDIVSDGEQLAVRDKKLGTQDVYPLWQTPLRYLLKDNLNLLEDARVVAVLQDQNVVTITIEEEGALAQGRLTLYFSAQDYSLLQWSIIDGRGIETNVTIANVVANKPNDAKIFALQ
ncbi:MAG: outer-membrane lipoprotein carrier protein LolA [Pseudomonadota bacterium]